MPRPAEMTCPTVRDRLDPLLDGDLTGAAEARLRAHLESCPTCREELRLARGLRQALREGLPTLQCPPEVSARVLSIARDEAAREDARTAAPSTPPERFSTRLRRWLAGDGLAQLRPATTFAAVAALVLLLLAVPFVLRDALSPGSDQNAPHSTPVVATSGEAPEYTAEEIAQAEEQARLVLAAIAQVGRGAGRTVRDEVFEGALTQPAQQVMDSLRGGIAEAHPFDRPNEADRSGRRP